jgi:predicted dehydrogenase
MEVRLNKTHGLCNDLLIVLARAEVEDTLFHIANRDRFRQLPGLLRHVPEQNPSERQQVGNCKIPIEEHLKQISVAGHQLLDADGRPQRRVIGIGSRNVRNNHGFIAWQRDEQPKLFHVKDDPLNHAAYSCLVKHTDGRLAIRALRFDEERVFAGEQEISSEIDWSVYANWVLRDGRVASIEEIIDQFYDIRHVLAFDRQHELGQQIEAGIFAGYPEHFRANALRAWREQGVPRNRFLHNGLGLSDDSVIILQREGTIEEVAAWLKEAGARDGVILDNGGSVFCWAWWLYPKGGYLFAAPDFRSPSSAVIALPKEVATSKPRFAQTADPLRLVIEGVGDVIKNYYEPALKALKSRYQGQREIEVTFADKSEFWRDEPDLAAKMRGIIDSVKSWGAGYLDKSDPGDQVEYAKLEADVVIIATPDVAHVEVAEEWLKRPARPEQIFIEKPLADSVNAARRLLGQVEPYHHGVLAFDHYRARLLPTWEQMNVLLGFLGKGPHKFTFYFLEDHSGDDEDYLNGNRHATRNGPIENEQRVKALRHGIILDLMPHVIALLAHFGRVETLRVRRVRAGQYVGVDGAPDQRTEIEKETFAEVGFVCAGYGGKLIEGKVYVGKGVRGVKSLGASYDHDVKVLELEAANGNKAHFNLRKKGQGAGRAYLIDQNGKTQVELPLYVDPYATFLEKVADGSYLGEQLALNVEHGKRMLELLEDMRYPIPDKHHIPTYPSGMSGIRPALYLEELLACLPVIYGK